MGIKTKYEAKDGKQFTDQTEAQEWDNTNFEVWLVDAPTINAKHFVESMNGSGKDEYYGSDRKLARDLLRQYWDSQVE